MTDTVKTSGIEWTGVTWNPWQGCSKVSPGCSRCYMFREKHQYDQDPTDVHRSADSTFYQPLEWQKQARNGERTGTDKLVFTCSWSDFFIEEADAWRDKAFQVMSSCPDLIFQVLTKRIDRAVAILEESPYWNDIRDRVWLGVSVENQAMANERIPRLVDFERDNEPAVAFVSCEPLIGPVNLTDLSGSAFETYNALNGKVRGAFPGGYDRFDTMAIDWVIGGGESHGHNHPARPMHPDWIRTLRDQCADFQVPFFFKQWGAYQPAPQSNRDGEADHDPVSIMGFGDESLPGENLVGFDVNQRRMDKNEPLEDAKTLMVNVGRHQSGACLDGQVHEAFPAPKAMIP